MTEMDFARQCAHNAEVKYVDDKNAFDIAYNSFLDGLKAGKKIAIKEMTQNLGEAMNTWI